MMDVKELRQSGHEVYAEYDFEGGGWYSKFVGEVNERKTRGGAKGACILMQFTGLKDKNGKKIYEGDIVKGKWGGKDQYFDIRYCEAGSDCVLGFFPMKDHETYNHYYGGWMGEEFEVVGNIHQHPELLK